MRISDWSSDVCSSDLRRFQLGGIDLDRAESRGQLEADLDPFADRPVEKVGPAENLLVEIEHFGLQRLPPREGQELTGEGGGARGSLGDRAGKADPFLLGAVWSLEDVGRGLDDRQGVVARRGAG